MSRIPTRFALALVMLLAARASIANEPPTRILVGFPPGGGSDIIARLVAERMRVALGMPVVVENRPGANGAIAAEALKNAPADGRTLMVSPIGVPVFAPLTHSKLRFDPSRDFAPVSLAAHFQLAWVLGPGTPARTLAEYLEWARARPANGSYGIPVAGGPSHFFGVLLAQSAQAPLQAIPYKGGVPMVTDLLGGQVPAAVTSLADVLKHHESGRLRIVAIPGNARSPLARDVPTFRELGFPQLEGAGWHAFHTTAGTPAPVVKRLSAAIAAALQANEVKKRLVAEGLEPVGSTPDELARRTAEDTIRWKPVIQASGFKGDE